MSVAPAFVWGGWQLASAEVVAYDYRYPTETDYEQTCSSANAGRVPPGSYDLVGTLTWCAKAYQADNGWWCEGPTTTRTEHRAVNITGL